MGGFHREGDPPLIQWTVEFFSTLSPPFEYTYLQRHSAHTQQLRLI